VAIERRLDRWVEARPGERTADVARRTLAGHLAEVVYWLKKAATKAERDAKFVHQLRVWTRRATAAIDLYQDLLPAKPHDWLRKRLKRIRKAANDARDCDVLIARLEGETPDKAGTRWLKATRAERAKAQEAIVASEQRVNRENRFRRVVKTLDQHLANATATPPFGPWARAHLRPFVDAFFASLPHDQSDLDALHRFRIRGKDLRYVMELLGAAFEPTLRTELYPTIEELHDRLGEVNDRATAVNRLRRHLKAKRTKKGGSWRKRLREEVAKLETARRQFWAWFGPTQIAELRRAFDECLA
jgi:CHAD domain-containing protein